MGQKLLAFYEKADQLGGLPAKIRLAVLSKCSSIQAKTTEDSAEHLQNMQRSFDQLQQEFKEKASNTGVGSPTITTSSTVQTVQRLRHYIQAFSDVLLAQAEHSSLNLAAQQITTVLADSIDVNRASIWLYNEDESGIVCIDLYERLKDRHSKGMVLYKKDFPQYFKTIGTNRTLAATNANTHPGTAEFSEVYLQPNGINSMLDVPIFVQGKMVGVFCLEHTGPMRQWNSDEENFAYLMSNILSGHLERQALN